MQPLSRVAKGGGAPVLTEQEARSVREFLSQEKSGKTKRAYQSDWKGFVSWCEAHGVNALPAHAEAVAAFLASEAERGMASSTISRRLAAIRYAHKLAEIDPLPTDAEAVRAVLRGIRRAKGTKVEGKAPVTAEMLKAMIIHSPNTLKGKRDKAILLLGFAGAFRRSELSVLTTADLEFVDDGLRVTIWRSKTDQEGTGFVKPIIRGATPSTCPVQAVRDWIGAAGITTGPVFPQVGKGDVVKEAALSGYSIGVIVKEYADKVGLDADRIGGHSLRSGFCTSAAMAGADAFKIMDVTGHKSVQTLRGYVRRADEFRNHAGAGLL